MFLEEFPANNTSLTTSSQSLLQIIALTFHTRSLDKCLTKYSSFTSAWVTNGLENNFSSSALSSSIYLNLVTLTVYFPIIAHHRSIGLLKLVSMFRVLRLSTSNGHLLKPILTRATSTQVMTSHCCASIVLMWLQLFILLSSTNRL